MADFGIMEGLALAGAAVSAAGTIAGGMASNAAGQSTQSAANFKATQEDMAAQESRASSQRAALEETRKAGLAQSTLQARAAASGGGAADPTILNLGGDIAGRGEYQALTDIYSGENKARGLEDVAAGDRLTGRAAAAEGQDKQYASWLSAGGTIIGGIGSAYRTYNRIPSTPAYG